MVTIQLRQDGWFEAGADSRESFPAAFEAYEVKQEIKTILLAISERALSTSELERELAGVEVRRPFKRTPYLRGNDIIVDTHGLPGEAYLGSLVQEPAPTVAK